MILKSYKYGLMAAKPLLVHGLLKARCKAGKEDPRRIDERMGRFATPRPAGPLIWVHAASVGEAQSALILIQTLLKTYENIHILVTTGTVTSADIMKKKLPARAFHQFYPLDHPEWADGFLSHWKPDLIFWMESELWPNMLLAIQARKIPAVLVNARLSPQSFKTWKLFRASAKVVLNSFSKILCQTEHEALSFRALGAEHVETTGNLKYSAKPLGVDEDDLRMMNGLLGVRPRWVYASTHAGEEELAARVHSQLQSQFDDLLTIIVLRHPARKEQVLEALKSSGLNIVCRGDAKIAPRDDTDLYIVDTMGELGLFYRACPIACIGRSFSNDGGGGHNPIEAAQLHCVVLHGPHVQNLQDIYDEMDAEGATIIADSEQKLAEHIASFLDSPENCHAQQEKAFNFAKSKAQVLEQVMVAVQPTLDQLDLKPMKAGSSL